jgi:hypothetical protein
MFSVRILTIHLACCADGYLFTSAKEVVSLLMYVLSISKWEFAQVLYEFQNQIAALVRATLNQHPPVHHPSTGCYCYSVVDESQLS